MLKVDSLAKRYGETIAVDGVSFEVSGGECFGLLGPNGAGKTTTISMICGVTKPDSGNLTLNGVSWNRDPASVKGRIGYVPQELALYQEIDARENLRFFGSLYGLFGSECEKRIDATLEMVGLSDRAKEPVSRFSGGMKRRLNIASGLLHEPDLLVLDEPTVGIDPQSRNAIFDTLELLRGEGKTLLYTTHYMEEVERLCQRVAIMDHGKIVAAGDLQELKQCEGNRGFVTIQLKQELDEGARHRLATQLGCRCEGPLILAPFEDLSRDISILLTHLAADGHEVVSVKSSEASLEQIFLRTTGRKLRD
jgi:ABC-2 type transport system ATP-binding protein